jgi:hypothetical protein
MAAIRDVDQIEKFTIIRSPLQTRIISLVIALRLSIDSLAAWG